MTRAEKSIVMAGHSRSKNGVASLAYVPAIHVFIFARSRKDVNDRPARMSTAADANPQCAPRRKKSGNNPPVALTSYDYLRLINDRRRKRLDSRTAAGAS